MTWAILATGESLTQDQVDAVCGLRVIAVSDAYKLAPWADAMVAADKAWWDHHQPEFQGRKFSNCTMQGTERLKGIASGINSGVVAIHVARFLWPEDKNGILLGFDGRGGHFFGDHPSPLKNTTQDRRVVHFKQHRQAAYECRLAGINLMNCSPGTAIPYYPKARLFDVLACHA